MKPTPVGLVWGRFLEWRYLQQVVVDEVVVADTALASVVQPVAHAARAVVVAGQVATDRVWFALESPDATFVYVLTHTCKKHRRVSIACHCHSCMTSLATSKSCRWTMDLWGCCRQVICFFLQICDTSIWEVCYHHHHHLSLLWQLTKRRWNYNTV